MIYSEDKRFTSAQSEPLYLEKCYKLSTRNRSPGPLRNPGLGVTQDIKYNTHRKYTSGPIMQKY